MKKVILFAVLTSISVLSFADSGFLDDYSMLQAVNENDRVYISPEFLENGAHYDSVMIDLPEIFISPDSRYKGMKGDDMTAWAESFREAIIAEIGDSYKVVEEAGDGVLFVSLALADVYLKKAKRGIFSYTPIGALTHAAKRAMENDFQKKISVIALSIELEVIDSQSGAILGQSVEQRGNTDEPTTWDEVNALMLSYGVRFTCRMDNTRRNEQVNCREM